LSLRCTLRYAGSARCDARPQACPRERGARFQDEFCLAMAGTRDAWHLLTSFVMAMGISGGGYALDRPAITRSEPDRSLPAFASTDRSPSMDAY